MTNEDRDLTNEEKDFIKVAAEQADLSIVLYSLEEFEHNELLYIAPIFLNDPHLDISNMPDSELKEIFSASARDAFKNDPATFNAMESSMDDALVISLKKLTPNP